MFFKGYPLEAKISKSLLQYAFIICFIVSKLFLLKLFKLLQNRNHICTKITRTHKINLWNEEPGHSAHETLSISAPFCGHL